jgi:hypothetical protein
MDVTTYQTHVALFRRSTHGTGSRPHSGPSPICATAASTTSQPNSSSPILRSTRPNYRAVRTSTPDSLRAQWPRSNSIDAKP